ncbi:hypothetical protein ACP70R_038404 [Stipagrostis hirtigluma subsp. patula]
MCSSPAWRSRFGGGYIYTPLIRRKSREVSFEAAATEKCGSPEDPGLPHQPRPEMELLLPLLPLRRRGMENLLMVIIGHAVSITITLASIPRVRRLRKAAVSDDQMLSMPLLCAPEHDLAARRVQCWLLASILHSLTLILPVYKSFSLSSENDLWRLFLMCSSPLFILIVSAVLLIILLMHYPITEDLWVTGFIIGSGCIAYLLIVLTDFIYLKSTVTLEIVLIPITICMHTLRFVSQSTSTHFEMIPLVVACLGVVPGILCLIQLRSELLAHCIKHLPLKVATLVGALFRLEDVIVICCSTTREAANYLRSRLQECFL